MASQKLRGAGKLRWTEDHRLALHLLKTKFELDSDKQLEAFAKMLNVNEITKATLAAQHRESNKSTASHLWQFLESDSLAEEIRWQTMRDRIAKTLVMLETGANSRPVNSMVLRSQLQSKTKRGFDHVEITIDHDNAKNAAPSIKRRRCVGVFISRSEQDAAKDTVSETASPSTPKARRIATARTPKAPRKAVPVKESATVWYDRPCGGLMITSKASQRTKEPLEWPNFDPTSPKLLFRYWIPDVEAAKESSLQKTGYFVARRFRAAFGRIDPGPAPTKEQPSSFWNDLYIHMDKKLIDTPFVSVSNSLAWTLREAIKLSEKGAKDVSISLISTEANAELALYYAPLYHRIVRKRYLFTRGAWRYPGTNEWLAFHSVKPFMTVSVSTILQMAANEPAIAACLRLKDLAGKGNYHNVILPGFRKQTIDFTAEVARGFAEIAASLFGFTCQTSPLLHKDLVSNFVEGWGLIPTEYKTKLEWNVVAANFAHSLIRKSPSAVGIETQEMLKAAFQAGVMFGLADRTAAYRMERFVQMETRANKLGLSRPGRILTVEYDAVKNNLFTFEKSLNDAIKTGKRQALLV